MRCTCMSFSSCVWPMENVNTKHEKVDFQKRTV